MSRSAVVVANGHYWRKAAVRGAPREAPFAASDEAPAAPPIGADDGDVSGGAGGPAAVGDADGAPAR